LIKLSRFTKNAIASVVSLQLILLPTVSNAVSMEELQSQAGITKEEDPNMAVVISETV